MPDQKQEIGLGEVIIDATTTAVIILSGLPAHNGASPSPYNVASSYHCNSGSTPGPDFWSDMFVNFWGNF